MHSHVCIFVCNTTSALRPHPPISNHLPRRWAGSETCLFEPYTLPRPPKTPGLHLFYLPTDTYFPAGLVSLRGHVTAAVIYGARKQLADPSALRYRTSLIVRRYRLVEGETTRKCRVKIWLLVKHNASHQVH